MKLNKGTVVVVVVVAGLCLAFLWIRAAWKRPPKIVVWNQAIQYDDFAFSVVGVRHAATLGTDADQQAARGVFYVVTLKVANHAKRVNYTFKPSSPILVDGDGREYRVSPQGQRAIDFAAANAGSALAPISPGSSLTTEVVFDVPPDVKDPQLRISTGGTPFDLFDRIFYGKMRISLQP